MTNTERLMKMHADNQRHGLACHFAVGKYTGNGVGVLPALRRRGYTVNRLRSSYYELIKS
ncbi:hypothetical protein ACI77O_12160 [Pseudomonas tritici]|uniref:hypothetical protein n=1 Tax=Pseudomonas tritici TaxID=2745518 RepID=UPI00387AD948